MTPASNVNFNGTQALRDTDGRKIETTTNFTSLIFEYEKNNGSFFKKNLSMFQWLHADNTPFFNRTSTIAPTSTTTGPVAALNISSNLDVSVDRLVGYTEYEGIFNSNFDFAAQFMYSKTRSKGDLLNCTDGALPDSLEGPQPPQSRTRVLHRFEASLRV